MKVKFLGATEDQLRWGGPDSNPNDYLEVGKEYKVYNKEVHSWHTVLYLENYKDKKFPQSAFEEVNE